MIQLTGTEMIPAKASAYRCFMPLGMPSILVIARRHGVPLPPKYDEWELCDVCVRWFLKDDKLSEVALIDIMALREVDEAEPLANLLESKESFPLCFFAFHWKKSPGTCVDAGIDVVIGTLFRVQSSAMRAK